MNAADILSMFEDIDNDTKEVIARRLRPLLGQAITSVNKHLTMNNMNVNKLTPRPALIMNAFRLCPLSRVKIVLIGQDPYIKPGEAMGLSFSVPVGRPIPPSLKAIYECLRHCGLINKLPTHGDLTSWAKQGILLLNVALTTVIGRSNAHTACWQAYTNALITELSNLPQRIIFILLGNNAQAAAQFITNNHVILKWGHPSPLNNANKTDNPAHFKYCDAFTRVNELLVAANDRPIDWSVSVNTTDDFSDLINTAAPVTIIPVEIPEFNCKLCEVGALDAVPPMDSVWVFTDGGASGNGRANCDASWAFYITDGCICTQAYGVVPRVDIPGSVYKSSNNRGELTAILYALAYIVRNIGEFTSCSVIVVSDSKYSIDSLTKWAPRWFDEPSSLVDKKNLDIISPALDLIKQIKVVGTIQFKHVRGHRDQPRDTSCDEWFYWKCNDIVDKLCGRALEDKK